MVWPKFSHFLELRSNWSAYTTPTLISMLLFTISLMIPLFWGSLSAPSDSPFSLTNS